MTLKHAPHREKTKTINQVRRFYPVKYAGNILFITVTYLYFLPGTSQM